MVLPKVGGLLLLLLLAFHDDNKNAVFWRTTTTTTALTLTAGQRMAPLQRNKMSTTITSILVSPPPPTSSSSSSSSGSTSIPKNTRRTTSRSSLLDLPAVEEWASIHGLTEHHLKILYRNLLQPVQRQQQQDVGVVLGSNNNNNNSKEHERHRRHVLQERLVQASFPRALAAQLLQDFDVCSIHLIERRFSRSGGEKLVLQLSSPSNHHHHNPETVAPPEFIETVLIRHTTTRNSSGTSTPRYTVCVSSQVGCARACTFCATGTLGLRRQLTSAELLEQVWIAQQLLPLEVEEEGGGSEHHPSSLQQSSSLPLVRNVVFMGMGEPLDNYAAVHEACRGLTHQCLFGLKGKHVTISTVGVSPTHVRRLADEAPSISLAVSLHGATPALRAHLLPATTGPSSSLPLLEDALDYHATTTGRGAMLEYLLIDSVNDSEEACDALIEFCRRRKQQQRQPVYVNLIPYNPTIAGVSMGYQTPTDAAILQFQKRLQQHSQFIQSHVRWSSAAGRDTEGACGQLALSVVASSSSLSSDSMASSSTTTTTPPRA